MSSHSDPDNFNRFEAIVSTQPSGWKIKLNEMYQAEPDVAVAAWTLISSMEDLDVEPEEIADFLERIHNKAYHAKTS